MRRATSTSAKKIQANLTGTTSLAAALAKLKAFASAHPDDPWILGRGWNQVTPERIDGVSWWSAEAVIPLG
jgi:predicted amidohydrolase YtcJ